MAMPAHLTLTGEKQGKIDGSCEMQGREKTILVYGMNHDVSYSPQSNRRTCHRQACPRSAHDHQGVRQ